MPPLQLPPDQRSSPESAAKIDDLHGVGGLFKTTNGWFTIAVAVLTAWTAYQSQIAAKPTDQTAALVAAIQTLQQKSTTHTTDDSSKRLSDALAALQAQLKSMQETLDAHSKALGTKKVAAEDVSLSSDAPDDALPDRVTALEDRVAAIEAKQKPQAVAPQPQPVPVPVADVQAVDDSSTQRPRLFQGRILGRFRGRCGAGG